MATARLSRNTTSSCVSSIDWIRASNLESKARQKQRNRSSFDTMSFVRSVFAPAIRVSPTYPICTRTIAQAHDVPIVQLSRTPRSFRALATQTPLPSASTSTSNPTPDLSSLTEGSTIANPESIFPGGDVDVTDSVLKMLESEEGISEDLARPISYLPLSSLASPNPALPSPSVSLSATLPFPVFDHTD